MPSARGDSFARRVLTNLISVGFAIGFLWAAGEIAVRAMTPPPDAGDLTEPLPGSPRIYRLRPGSTGCRSGVSVRINSGGFRDREFPEAKPAGAYRILVLGDSFTMGLGVPADSTYAKRLERTLAAEPARGAVRAAGHDSVETLNFGVGGYNTLQERLLLDEVGFRYAPDLVLVGVNLNDVYDERGRVVRSEQGVVEHRALDDARTIGLLGRVRRTVTSSSRFASFVDYRLGQLRRRLRPDAREDTEFNRLFRSDNPGYARLTAELTAIRDDCAAHGAELLVALLPNLTNLDTTYPYRGAHAALGAFADSTGLPFVDLLPPLLGRKPDALWVSWDNPHPNSAAQRILSDTIVACLRERRLGPFAGPSPPTHSATAAPVTGTSP